MEKLIEKLDDLFEKYKVSEEEIAEVGELLSGIGGELETEGEDDFAAPSMGDEEDGEYEEADKEFED